MKVKTGIVLSYRRALLVQFVFAGDLDNSVAWIGYATNPPSICLQFLTKS